ncbi:MAG: LamG domain-containing protein [Candidatus Aenigmarchaeota archaeon]|nr:LamG domain-containing protein [Candidatus Aenigmarchaeota archaeon]
MDISFIVAISVFLIFVALVLVSTINYFTRTPESVTIIELRDKTKSLFDILFGSSGIPTNERVTTDLYRIPLLLQETNGTNRVNEIVSLSVAFDDLCNKLMSWNNTVRVYDQQFNELPSKISYQEFCSGQWLNTSIVSFIVNISANENKKVYVYSINNTNTSAPNHNITREGYWKFDEAGGTVAKDSSGYQNNGTLTNFDFNSSSGWFNGTNCKSGSCLKFDGLDDYVSITGGTTNLPIGTTPRTVAAWVNTTMSGLGEIVSYGNTATGEAFTVGVSGAAIFVSSWGSPQYTVTATVNDGKWHHVLVTFDGTSASTYLDGVLLDTRGFSINTGSGTANIGTRISPTEYFNGTIDDVRIYNKTLTTAEIASVANATLLTVTSFPAENVTAISAAKLQNLTSRDYKEVKAILGNDFDFRVEVTQK